MARKLVLQNLMRLAKDIGANQNKFMGTRSNISFLGKGPTRNPLFQGPVPGIEAEVAAGEPSKRVISAIEDAMGYAHAGKLNTIQIRALELNLESLNKVLNPPVLPSATVTPIAKGLPALERVIRTRFPKESHKFFGRPLKDKDFVEIDELVKRGKLPPAEGRLPDPGSAGVTAMLEQKTGMSRAIAREILQQDTRLNLRPEELYSLRTGAKGADPIDLMVKYYGRSMEKFDDFLNQVNLEAASPTEFAEMVLKNIKLVPQLAHGGLARILEV
mgnify:CR=1 FL=1